MNKNKIPSWQIQRARAALLREVRAIPAARPCGLKRTLEQCVTIERRPDNSVRVMLWYNSIDDSTHVITREVYA